jgi:hypothetical protein
MLKGSWPNLRYYLGIFLGTEEKHNKRVKIAGFQAEI